MKNKWLFFCCSLVLICLVSIGFGCKSSSGKEEPTGTLLGYQGCKELKKGAGWGSNVASNQDCLEYHYSGQKLELKHINAAFNCCPGAISTDISVNGKIITITELEETAQCLCLCLFDLNMEIDDLESGEYTIRVNELYIDDGDEPLEFTVQLSSGVSGSYCLERNHYPWID